MPLPNDFRIDERVIVQHRANEDEHFRDIGSHEGIKDARTAIEESKLDGQFQMIRRSPILAVGEVKRREATLVSGSPSSSQAGEPKEERNFPPKSAVSPADTAGTPAKKSPPAITRSSATA